MKKSFLDALFMEKQKSPSPSNVNLHMVVFWSTITLWGTVLLLYIIF